LDSNTAILPRAQYASVLTVQHEAAASLPVPVDGLLRCVLPARVRDDDASRVEACFIEQAFAAAIPSAMMGGYQDVHCAHCVPELRTPQKPFPSCHGSAKGLHKGGCPALRCEEHLLRDLRQQGAGCVWH